MDKIILTGATGFLGSHVFEALIEKTDFNIVVLKRTSSNISRIGKYINCDRVECINVDEVCIERRSFENCSAIIHLATD